LKTADEYLALVRRRVSQGRWHSVRLDSPRPPLQTPAPMRINAALLALELSLPHAGREGCA
jgi:hypothetical protein